MTKLSRNIIEQRARDYVVRGVDRFGKTFVSVWSTHENAVKYARLMHEAGASGVTIDGKAVGI